MTRAILVCGCAALALSACSKKSDTAATGGTAPDAAVASAPGPVTPPTRKAGLWEQTMVSESAPVGRAMNQTLRMCVDDASEAKMKWWATENRKGGSTCAEQSVSRKLGGGWSFHSVCDVGDGGKVTADGEATGDFGSHYKVEIHSVMTGSPMAQANVSHKMTMEATWKGPCPAGMKGGDIEMPGGMKINTLDAARGAAPTIDGLKPGQRPTPEQIAQMRAQAMAMAKAAREQQGK